MAEALSHCNELKHVYLCKMMKHDAKRIVELHIRKHGVAGLYACYLKNCPVALQGFLFTGKEGYPTIVLEAVANFSLRIWHAAFGFAGGLNDLNIWENSLLLDDMVSGAFSAIGFPFEVGGQFFEKLFFLVDGIIQSLCALLDPFQF